MLSYLAPGCCSLAIFVLASTALCSIQPLVVEPSEVWDGLDGTWSSFNLSVGVAPQDVRILPSWMSYQTWLVAPEACAVYSNYNDCVASRGQVFNYSQSTDFSYIGLFDFGIEQNLGYEGNAYYGYDTIILGNAESNGTTVAGTTIGAYGTSDFWLGNLGLNPKPSNWSASSQPAASFMARLKAQKSIPSISFGYTAGASYRSEGVLGSLTIGGYDQSRFAANDFEFDFASDSAGDTVVGIQSITTQARNSSSSIELLPAPIYALIDSTVSQIWLPLDACRAFEQEFGLVWDETYEMYLVNSSLHDSLLSRNAYLNFTIGPTTSGFQKTTISFPYAAFDLAAQSPYQGLADRSYYFPLRRAQNETQYVLGRTFMQEAYITVDYERAKFNVSQCTWPQTGNNTQLVAIEPAPESENSGYSGANSGSNSLNPDGQTTPPSSAKLGGGAIAGIAVGSVAAVCALIGIVTWYIRRERKKKALLAEEEKGDGSPSRDSNGSIYRTTVDVGEKGTTVFPKAELEGSNVHDDVKSPVRPESSLASPTTQGYGTWSTTQADPTSPGAASEAGGLEIYEMPGDMPELAQADGRSITEKEMMMRREQIYNGVDLSNPATPTQEVQSPMERRSVQPGDVVVRGRIHEEELTETGSRRFSFE